MRISLILATLILAVFVWLGWREEARFDAVKQAHESAVSAARSLGIDPDALSVAGTASSGHARFPREDAASRAENGRNVAEKLMAFSNAEVDPNKNPEAFARYTEGVQAMLNLDKAGLEAMVEAIRGNKDLSDQSRAKILGDSLGLLAMSGREPGSVLALFAGPVDLGKDLEPSRNSSIVRSAILGFAKENPVAAIESLSKISALHPEFVDDNTRISLLAGAAAQDPSFAFSAMGELGLSANPSASETIAGAARTPEERRTVLDAMRAAVVKSSGEQDREAIAHGAISGLAAGIVRDGFTAATSWLGSADFTPGEAAIFASSIPPGDTKGDSGQWIEWMADKLPADQLAGKTGELMETWTKSDYTAAGTWLSSIKDGPTKEAAVRSYAATVAPYDPATAAQWGLTLPEGSDRTEVLKGIQAEWEKQDPSAAGKFAAENGLSQ
jgi:hypothetical protein